MFRRLQVTDRLYYLILSLALALVLILGYGQSRATLLAPGSWSLHLWMLRDPLAMLLFGASLSILAWRVAFALRYRPYAGLAVTRLPRVTVVIPAYNEGEQVLSTVRSVLASDYPHRRLSVVCVDDGSRDDTWHWMTRAGQEFPRRVEIIRQPRNMGKRAALMRGFERAKGDVIVTLDSDSEILPRTLQELVSPFVHDARVGSVAGNVRVLNLAEGPIPKMLDVSFTSAFDFIRAGQSVYGGVFCTPGALSAYRAPLLKSLVGEWAAQTFLGYPAAIGEDRALTNLVLAAGHRVVYQRDAVVLTKVPTNYTSLRKMLLRWARSNVRENLVMFSFIFRRFRPDDTGANWVRLFSVLQVVRMTLFEALKLVLLVALLRNPVTALLAVSFGCVIGSIVPAVVHHRRYGGLFGLRWALPYTFYWLFCLAWISVWGLLTAGNSGWLTRNVTAPTKPVKLPAAA
ncbi:MAG: glycosyltransferase family 2 protein [Gammaproteobacteria bacterium]|nr:glycosyltransferase family 2 protein [Gammaproteobacteria bacterium]MDH4254713.1 glycosyltransferase family 2 protein [Gammaproteobacteria bacterium]MDH5308816.1 glycosyltransferase family 2 protein [Gammaproteobacteria bacterium]